MGNSSRVFVTRQLPGPAFDRLRQECDVRVWPGVMPPDRQSLLQEVADCEGVLALLTDRVDAELMDAAGGGLRVISNYAVGYNNIDLAAAAARGISVGNTPDVLTDATADMAVTLMLAAARRVREASDEVRRGDWKTWDPRGWLGVEPGGKTLGIVGMGRIGEAVARRMVGGWQMNLLYTSRSAKPDVDSRLGGRKVDLETLMAESDFLSVHVSLSEQTKHLIDAAMLSRVRPDAVLVNTARGEIIDQEALADAVEQGRLRGVGLDVTTPEPLPTSDRLVGLPGVTIVPHIGSATTRSRYAMTEIAVDNLLAGLRGDPLRCPVMLEG